MGRKSREKRERAQQPEPAAARARHIPESLPLFPGRQVLLVVAVALVWRVLYAAFYHGTPFFHVPVVDASTFHLWAQAIGEGRSFMPGVYFKPPLYPHVLAFLYSLFGARPEPVYVVQALMGAGTCVLVLGLGRRLFQPRTALWGALICAVLPILPFLEFQLVAEPLTTLLGLAALLLVVSGSHSRGRLALAGLLLGVAALGRPNLLILVPVLAVWLWHREGRRLGLVLIVCIAAGVGIAPATLHNLSEGKLVLVSANAGANLWTGMRPGADGVAAIPIGIRWDDLQLEAEQAGARGPAAADSWLMRRALEAAAADPLRALGLLAKKTLLLVNAHEGRNNIGADYLARTQGVPVLHRWWPGFWLLAPLALLGLVGVGWPRFLGQERAPPAMVPVLLTLAALALAILPFFVNARFRQPFLPLLALFAAHGLMIGLAAVRVRGPVLIRSAAILVLAFALVNLPAVAPDQARSDAEDELNLASILASGYAGRPADVEAALARLEIAARLDPQNPDIAERRGLYNQMAAYELLDAADRAQRTGQDPGPLHGAARQHLLQATAQHREAIRLFPRSFRSYGSAGNAHLLLGRLLYPHLETALAAGDTTGARPLAREVAGDLEAATLAWQAALRLKPDLPGGREDLAMAHDLLARLPEIDPQITAAKERVLR